MTISGFGPALALMALYHITMVRKDRKIGVKTARRHIAAVYVFCFVLALVLAITGVPGIYNLAVDSKVNMVPFAYFPAMYRHYIMNVLLFVPVGFLLPLLWKRFGKWRRTLLCGFAFTLSIEIIQLFNERVTDIDDLLMNTLGTMVGFLVFVLINKTLPRISVFSSDGGGHLKGEPYVCFAFVWLSFLVFKPVISGWLFGVAFPLMNGAP